MSQNLWARLCSKMELRADKKRGIFKIEGVGRRGALYTVYSSIYGIFVHILDTLHEYLLSDYYMLCIQFPPLQGGGHRFKSCTAHQGNQGVTAYAVTPFLLYTLFCTHASGVGIASMAAVFWSLRTCW